MSQPPPGPLALVAAASVRGAGLRAFLRWATVALVALIGAALLVLSVHWPGDVLARRGMGGVRALGRRRLARGKRS